MTAEAELRQPRGQRKAASADGVAARQLLVAPTTAAVVLLSATKALLGDFDTWEPESLWLELERRGLEVPAPNRVKLQAALTLLWVPSFYWDGVVFEKTALAFDHVVTNPDALEEATAAQLAWAVREAAWILSRQGALPHDFAHEPAAYTAVVLHREGLVEAPESLAFAQLQLDRLNRGGDEMRPRVEASWQALVDSVEYKLLKDEEKKI